MTSPETRLRALVLKKTKLGESDLILSMMASDGSAVRAVAKGARKPKNASSATLDLFNEADLTIVSGKNLGIAKGSRLLAHHEALHADPARFATASVIAEAAEASIQPDLPVENLFDMTSVAFAAVSEAPEATLPLIASAYAFKLTALLGMRPSFAACAICGAPLAKTQRTARFSYVDGGAICNECAAVADTTSVSADALRTSQALLRSTFADICSLSPGDDVWDVVDIAELWLASQTSARLKSFGSFKVICGCLQASTVL